MEGDKREWGQPSTHVVCFSFLLLTVIIQHNCASVSAHVGVCNPPQLTRHFSVLYRKLSPHLSVHLSCHPFDPALVIVVSVSVRWEGSDAKCVAWTYLDDEMYSVKIDKLYGNSRVTSS